MTTKYIRVASPSQQTLADISIALINDVGPVEDKEYLVRTRKVGSSLALELVLDGVILKQVFLVIATTPKIIDLSTMKIINEQAETMFREESIYGVKDRAGVERIIGSIFNGYGDVEFFPGVIKKAAAYWQKFATTQMFNNGNKRSALLAALYYLYLCGFSLPDIDGNELYNLTVDVANQKVTLEDLEEYIRRQVGMQYFDNLEAAINSVKISFEVHFKIDNPNE
jgi:death-on-curing family protein